MTAPIGSWPHEVPGRPFPHNMEYTPVGGPLAVPRSKQPGSYQDSQSNLDWGQGSGYSATAYSVGIDALTSGARLADAFDSTQTHKRRRIGRENSPVGAPQYAAHFVPYDSLGLPGNFDMIETRDTDSTQAAAAVDVAAQPATGSNNLFSGSWDGTDRFCCGPWWPSLPTFYAPVSQSIRPSGLFEPYRDVVTTPTPIVSQQYVSPELIELPGMKYNEAVASLHFPAEISPPTGAGVPPDPLMADVGYKASSVGFQPLNSDSQLALLCDVVQPASVECYSMPPHPLGQELDCMSLMQASPRQAISTGQNNERFAVSKQSAGPPTYNDHTIVFDVVNPNFKSKRGPFKDETLRQQTAETRNHGACIECARQRIRCIPRPDDPLGPCLNCVRMLTARLPRIPCLRYRITDVKLSKTGQVPGFEWTWRWKHARRDIKHWESEEVKTIYISEGLSDTHMEIHVKRFVPQQGDKMVRSWVHQGARRSVPIPPYALTKLEDAKEAYRKHIVTTESGALKHVLALSSPLLRETYELAANLRYEEGIDETSKNLLHITFQLWMVVRFSTMSTWIVGEETLGMPRNILDASPNPGRIPLPPVLGAQLDSILIHEFQDSIRRKLLRQLDRAFRKYKHPNWLIMYLVSFLLLHNAALITAHDAKYAQKHGMKRRFAREQSVAEYHQGATIILAHFHNCTRNTPFSDECNDTDLKNLSKMTEDQIRFIRDTRVYIKMHAREWEKVREEGRYEDDFYFVSQLYQEPWKPQAFSVGPSSPGSEGSEGSSEKSEFEGGEPGSDQKE